MVTKQSCINNYIVLIASFWNKVMFCCGCVHCGMLTVKYHFINLSHLVFDIRLIHCIGH